MIAKVCSCGRKYTWAEWDALPSRGYVYSEDEGGRYRTELRTCPCGSTVAVELRLSWVLE